jgi:hypothetical protein
MTTILKQATQLRTTENAPRCFLSHNPYITGEGSDNYFGGGETYHLGEKCLCTEKVGSL